jgi:hypothetical protein
MTLNLSIVTFRYHPPDLGADGAEMEAYVAGVGQAVDEALRSTGMAAGAAR